MCDRLNKFDLIVRNTKLNIFLLLLYIYIDPLILILLNAVLYLTLFEHTGTE